MFKYHTPISKTCFIGQNKRLLINLSQFKKKKTHQSETNTSLKYVKDLQLTLQRQKSTNKKGKKLQRTCNTIDLSSKITLPTKSYRKKENLNAYLMARINQRDRKLEVGKINPYTKCQYLCFTPRKNFEKFNKAEKKSGQIHKILRPFSIYKINMVEEDIKKPQFYSSRPKSTVQKRHIQRSRCRSTNSSYKMKNKSFLQKPPITYQGQIEPWEFQNFYTNY